MRVVIRVDASQTLGSGHLMRCLTLADELRAQGAEVSFVCGAGVGDLSDLAEARGFARHRISAASWPADAQQTSAAIASGGPKPAWLIVDHYDLDERWQAALCPSVDRIMVVDDLANRPHDCDLLLDQNLVARMHERYTGRTRNGALLLGPTYALLQPEYAQLRARVRPRSGSIRRILVSFGAADRADVTGRVVAAFASLQCQDVQLDVVIAGDGPHANALRERAAQCGNIRLHERPSSLAQLIAQADLAVGAAGTTSWERLCLGLPTHVVTIAANQEPIAVELDRLGLVRLIGKQQDVDAGVIARALREQLARGLEADWSRRCLETVDGLGAQRVAAIMRLAAGTPLRVRLVAGSDEALLLQWANDPMTRRNAFSPEPIPPPTHHAWLQQRLNAPDRCRFYIVETGEGVPVGQVRFERSNGAWEIHYSLAPYARGRGLGRALLHTAIAELDRTLPAAPLFGRVKRDNERSCRIFEGIGFEAREAADDTVTYWRGSARMEEDDACR